MKCSPDFLRRLHWLNLPGALLVALLQRTPVLRLVALADEMVIASRLGAVLRSATATVGSLGALHTLAGATEFVINRTSPIAGTVGQPLQPAVSFTYNGTPTSPARFDFTGSLPPGLNFIPAPSGNTIPSGTPVIAGTPTQAGSFSITVQGFNPEGLTNNEQQLIEFNITGTTSPPAFTIQPGNQTVSVGATITLTAAASGSPAPTFQWQKNGAAIVGATSSTLTLNNAQISDAGTYRVVATNSAGSATSNEVAVVVNAPASSAPVFTTHPSNQFVAVNGNANFSVAASGSPAFQWQRNGVAIAGATSASLTVANVQPEKTGIYYVVGSNLDGTATSRGAALGVSSPIKIVGPGTEFPDIFHGGTGFTYDQILLEGAAASVRADSELNQILRISYIDMNDDIVQVEFSGPGTLSLVLDGVSGPAPPIKYNQAVTYMKGNAGIVLVGATENTHLSVFSVGRANAVNQALFMDNVTYDGLADVSFIAIASIDGKFGGLRAANASLFGTRGLTGVLARNVEFTGPVFIGEISAFDQATPVLQIGSGSDVRITGGDLFQDNGRAVQVSGIAQLRFTAGSTSHGTLLSAKNNQAVLEQDGVNITSQIVVNP